MRESSRPTDARLTSWARLVACGLLMTLAAPGLGCAASDRRTAARRSPDEIEMGLKRGASWTTFTLRRGRIVGPGVSLEIKKGKIRGFLGEKAIALEIAPDEVSGFADGRSVQLDIDERMGALEVMGLWNGERIQLEITPHIMRGHLETVSTRGLGVEQSFAAHAVGHCQFVLDRIDRQGLRSGTSICSGMPEETVLEFPGALEKWLTRSEAVAVLLALLSYPPWSRSDDAFSRRGYF